MEIYEKLDPEFKAKWVAALRSGEYKQGVNKLFMDGKYCCLGVACDVAGVTDVKEISVCGMITMNVERFPEVLKVPELLRGNGKIPQTLARMNDGRRSGDQFNLDRKSFSEIADWIEANL